MANGKIDLQQIVAQGPTARMQGQEAVRAFNSTPYERAVGTDVATALQSILSGEHPAMRVPADTASASPSGPGTPQRVALLRLVHEMSGLPAEGLSGVLKKIKVSEPKGPGTPQRALLESLAQKMSGLPAGGQSGVLKKIGEKLSDFVGPVQLSSDNMKDMQTVDASGEGATKQRNLALELANMKAGIEGTPETRALDIGRVATSPIEEATLPAEPGGEMGLLEKVMSGLSAAGKGFADVGNQLIKTPEGRQVLFQLGQLVGGEKITPFGPSQSQLQKRALSGLLAGESPKTAFSPALTPENQQSALASAQRQEALNIQQGNLDLQKRKLDASLNAPTGINPADWDDILQHLTGEFFSAAREQMPENIRTIAGFKEALGGPEGRLSSAKIRDILTPEQQDAWNQATVIGEAIMRETGSRSAAMTAMTKFVRESLGGGQGAGGDQIKGTSQAASSGGRNIIQIQEGPNAASQIDAVSDKDEFRYKGKVYVKRNNRYFPVGE